MSTIERQFVKTVPLLLASRWRHLAVYGCAAAVAFPLAVLIHELGHYLAGLVLRIPGLRLHYGTVSDLAVEAGVPLAAQAAQDAAGPLTTLAVVAAGCAIVARAGPRPYAVALVFGAPVRFAVGIAYLLLGAYVALHGGRMGRGNFDELNVATAAGIPVGILVAAEVAVTLLAWRFVLRRLPSGGRGVTLAALAVGGGIGLTAWMVVVGPFLLP